MPCKRRNNGRSKMNQGHTRPVNCSNCNRMVPKDKCIKKFTVRDMIDASSKEDIRAVQIYENFIIPKTYNKLTYCVSCAIHARIVRSRAREDRKIRNTRKPFEARKDEKKAEETKDA